MKSINILSLAVTVGLVLAFLPRVWCHVIGGGLNTDFSVKETKNLLTALSHITVTDLLSWETAQEAKKELWAMQRPQNKRRRHRKRKPSAPRRHRGGNDLLDDVDSMMDERKTGRMFNSGDLMTPLSDMWRRKRDVRCALPRSLYKQLRHLNRHYDVTSIFRFSANENVLVPSTDLVKCVNASVHSSGECTVKVSERLLSPDYYPRYVRDLECLQTTSSRPCQTVHLEVTVFKKVSCNRGKAVLKAVNIPVTAGCSCVQQTPQPTTIA